MASMIEGKPSASTTLGSAPRASCLRTSSARSLVTFTHQSFGAAAPAVPANKASRLAIITTSQKPAARPCGATGNRVVIAQVSIANSGKLPRASTRGLGKQLEKVTGSMLGHAGHGNAAQLGDLFRHMDHQRRIVGFTPE